MSQTKINNNDMDGLLMALSRVNRQVELIDEGNLTVKGTGERRLDVIARQVDICSAILK